MARTIVAVLMASLGLCLGAGAQTTRGRLVGSVVDQGGTPLPGVTVVATSPALQGSAHAVSDANGRFRLLMLPPGTYTAATALPGFQRVEQRGIRIGLEQTITLEVTLSPAFAEQVTVTSEAPAIDVTSTTVGADLGPQLIDDLPAGRSYQALTFLAPGAVDGGLAGNPAILGSSAAENRIVVNELDITDPVRGTAATGLSFNFIQEIQVKTGGYRAEYGGALGGVVNMITKSGSNELHGDLFAYYTDEGFAVEAKIPRQVGESVTGYTDWDVGFDLGGSIIRDRLWYFVALNPSFRDTTRVRQLYADGELAQRNVAEDSQDRAYYAAKLTWQVGPRSSVVASVFGDPTDCDACYATTDFVDTSYLPTDPIRRWESGSDLSWSVTWHAVPDDDLLIEAAVGRHNLEDRITPRSFDLPQYSDLTTDGRWSGGVGGGVGFGGLTRSLSAGRRRDQVRAAVTWFLGDAHQLKGGIQESRLEAELVLHPTGPSPERCVPVWANFSTNDSGYWTACDTNGDGVDDGLVVPAREGTSWSLHNFFAIAGYRRADSHGTTDELALFLQDSWQVTDFLTLDLGVRADSIEVTGEGAGIPKVPGMTNRIGLSLADELQPRVGVIWDFAHNGRSKAFAHYGKFYESIPLDINVEALGNERSDLFYYFYPADGSLPSLGQDGLPYDPGLLGRHRLYWTGSAPVESDLEGQYLEEYLLGVEYEVAPDVVVGLTGIYRSTGQVIEDVSVDGAQTYFIANPGGWYSVNPATGEELPEPEFFPRPSRIFRGVELALKKRYADAWQLYASLLWSSVKGNYLGLYRQDNGQLNPNLSSWDLPVLLEYAYGPLPNDHKWQLKAFGSYRWEWGLTSGFAFSWLTGAPISKVGYYPNYGADRLLEPRGSAGRTPTLMNLDVHLSYPFRIGGLDVELVVDVFNALNQQKAITVDETYTLSESPETDDDQAYLWPYYKEPTLYQAPRNYRLGFKLSW